MKYRRLPAIFGHALALALSLTLAAASQAQVGTVSAVYSFTNSANPNAALIQGVDKALYGTTVNGGANGKGTIFKIAPGGALTTLHDFSTASTDGVTPYGGLVQASDGNFYGTTYQGGANGLGAIYEITPTGVFSIIHDSNFSDGAYLYSTLFAAADGYLYGTATTAGGSGGNGDIFKISVSTPHTYQVVHTFASNENAGAPYAGVILAPDGNFYGTTNQGGAVSSYGTVYRVTPGGVFSLLHSFQSTVPGGVVDGASPLASLVVGPDNFLYGTTPSGGINSQGTIFKIALDGTSYSIVHNFQGGADGQNPAGALIKASDGNLYGTTAGTTHAGSTSFGTIFQLNTSTGTVTTLYSFPSNAGAAPQGVAPQSALLQASDGNFYGTAQNGGTTGSGTVFLYHTGLTIARPYNFDLNGDGSDDLLFQNTDNGDVSYAFLQGTIPIPNAFGYFLRLIQKEWHVVGQPDLNRDGHPDILWQNVVTGDVAYHLMNGVHYIGFDYVLFGVDLQWKIVGTPDLNGDGYPDIVWQSSTTGDIIYNLMKGPVPIANSFGYIFRGVGTQWKIVGTPDLNGDGHPDMVFQNSSTGAVSYTFMNGITAIPNSSGFLFPGLAPSWQIVGTPDLNGDGNPDFLFQNTQSGDMSFALMQGITAIGSGYVYRGLPLNLRVVGDH